MSTDENSYREEYRSQKVTMEQLDVSEEQYIESRKADEAGDVPAVAFDSAETLGAAAQAALEADAHPEVLERLGVSREQYVESAIATAQTGAE